MPRKNGVLTGVPADLRTDAEPPRLVIEQEDGDVPQMEVVARDGKNALQDLVQVKRREHGLPRIVQDRNLRHSGGILAAEKVTSKVPQVTGFEEIWLVKAIF
jgi:hypothetical protein